MCDSVSRACDQISLSLSPVKVYNFTSLISIFCLVMVRMFNFTGKMLYCPANISLFDIWVDQGVSQCFMDTISYSFLLMYLMIFGLWELWMYRKYGTPQSYNNLPKSKLYLLQLFITYLLSLLASVRFFVQMNYVYHGQVYGFMVRYY